MYVTKPSKLTNLGILTLVSGILNLLGACGLSATVVIATLGIGLLCLPVTILPAILGGFEIYYGLKLMKADDHSVKAPQNSIAILQICTFIFGNMISGAIGIVALVFYNDPEVKAYFDYLNGRPVSQPINQVPQQPAPPPPQQQSGPIQ